MKRVLQVACQWVGDVESILTHRIHPVSREKRFIHDLKDYAIWRFRQQRLLGVDLWKTRKASFRLCGRHTRIFIKWNEIKFEMRGRCSILTGKNGSGRHLIGELRMVDRQNVVSDVQRVESIIKQANVILVAGHHICILQEQKVLIHQSRTLWRKSFFL